MSANHVRDANIYARRVVAGKIPACHWVKKACARQIADLARAKTDPAWPYVFDPDKANRVCRFLELLPHVKGEWAKRRERIVLGPWQKFILTTVFGWVCRDDGTRRFDTGRVGTRRFRVVYEEVGRKNAKSTKLSGLALYMTALDGEAGAECYSAATKKDQARIVFGTAQAMARKSTEFRLRYGIEVFAHNIFQGTTGSRFEALDAEGKTQDGLNIHFAAVDELHAHKTRELYDVLESGMGSRAQPLMWIITTAGTNRSGICYEQRTYVTKILNGVIEDDTYFGIIYTLDEGDDWTDPRTWIKANPNLGVSVFEHDIQRLCAKARQMPAARNTFKTKRLNIWCSADVAWMDMDKWAACADPALDIADFEGEDCIEGVDLATKVDIAARTKLFVRRIDDVDHYYLFGRYYVPEAAVAEGVNDQYAGWEEDGRLIATPGETIDIDLIEDDIRDDARRFPVLEVAYDPYQATQMAAHLADEDFEMVEMRPTVLNFSEPMKELDALVRDGRLHHDGDPVLTWMVSNVVCHTDAKDNIYPRKERPENKIDGVVAAIMALGRAIALSDADTEIDDDYECAA